VVGTAGPWVNELLAEPLPVKATRETVCYFRPADDRPIPSVVSFKPARHTHDMYSLHDPVYGLKVGAHHAGPEADPNVPGEPEPHLIERIAAWAGETYLLASPEPAAAETCMYTTTADETFVLERRGRVVVGSPCSGHGFKFAPAIGERLARVRRVLGLERVAGPVLERRRMPVPEDLPPSWRDLGLELLERTAGGVRNRVRRSGRGGVQDLGLRKDDRVHAHAATVSFARAHLPG
jgi:hypothetical protein